MIKLNPKICLVDFFYIFADNVDANIPYYKLVVARRKKRRVV